MRNRGNLFYSLILGCLIIVSVYQTEKLWFDDLSNYNLFYSFIQSFNPVNKINLPNEDKQAITKPWRLCIYYPNSKNDYEFAVIRNTTLDYEQIYQFSNRMLLKLINKKKDIKLMNLNYSKLWKQRAVFFEYPFTITQKIFNKNIDINNTINIKDINGIQQIVIVPAELSDQEVKCYLVNYKSNKMYQITANLNSLDNENEVLNKKLNDEMIINYISTKKDGITKFSNNVLLPASVQNVYKVKLTNPFMKNNKIEKNKLGKYVNNFFVNPALKWSGENKKEHSWIYGDDRITVKFNALGVIEYLNTISGKQKNIDITHAYEIANNFLKKDELLRTLQQEYYLENLKIKGNNVYFYYEYRLNDYQYVLSEHLKKQLGIQYPIEIMIQGDKVKYYKRLILNKEIIKTINFGLTSTYNNALDVFYEDYKKVKDQPINDMYLAYYQESIDKNPEFTWVINVNDVLYRENP